MRNRSPAQTRASGQEIADAFTEAQAIPGKADFAAFVDKRFEGGSN
ncbi:hypothetical protein [Antrihabitans spumae]|uniref:Uncharacterized protein n=1 Tax=Antrihabitans spumae TaxID=3373370 RepID=A0ABW7K7B9_9NOCA